MKRLHLILLAIAFSTVAGGCLVSGHAHVRSGYSRPRMVYVSPGVEVVYDYHEPVFYSEGYYWRYHGNVWYRSSYHSHGWVRYRNVPRAVVTIDRPHTYVRYRGHGEVRGRGQVRDHRDNRREVREDRRERREDRRERVEDKRERREDKRERREDARERREDKRERREDKRERKEDRRDKHDNGGKVNRRDHRR